MKQQIDDMYVHAQKHAFDVWRNRQSEDFIYAMRELWVYVTNGMVSTTFYNTKMDAELNWHIHNILPIYFLTQVGIGFTFTYCPQAEVDIG